MHSYTEQAFGNFTFRAAAAAVVAAAAAAAAAAAFPPCNNINPLQLNRIFPRQARARLLQDPSRVSAVVRVVV